VPCPVFGAGRISSARFWDYSTCSGLIHRFAYVAQTVVCPVLLLDNNLSSLEPWLGLARNENKDRNIQIPIDTLMAIVVPFFFGYLSPSKLVDILYS